MRPLDSALMRTDVWQALIGDCWPCFLHIAESAPSAEIRIAGSKLDAIVRDATELAEKWCERVGLRLSAEGDELYIEPIHVVAAEGQAA
jgi:hypothetical protein